MQPTSAEIARPQDGLENQVTSIGRRLSTSLVAVLGGVPPGAPHRPQALAGTLGLDKVLTSRTLKAARHRDPMAVVHLAPGPEPLRRLVRAASRHGAAADAVRDALSAIDEFEGLIRDAVGDRSALDAIISAWLPEARQQFELRRKQTAYRAMSELKGCSVDVNLGTVLLHPSSDGEHVDVVWIIGLLGLRRLRPGATAKFATRRIAEDQKPRSPVTLKGEAIDGMHGVRLDQFCDAPPAPLRAQRIGDVVQYSLAGEEFGPGTDVDLLMAEVNIAEMERHVPRGEGRKHYFFSEVTSPAKTLVFDVLVHRDLYMGSEPTLHIYDTIVDGVASVNDRTRDVDRFDLLESVTPLGRGTSTCRAAEIPGYVDMLRYVFGRMEWDESLFRCHRCRIEYPIYGSQVMMAFEASD